MLTKMFLFISLSIKFFYAHRREQERVRASINRENESSVSRICIYRRGQDRVRASVTRANEFSEYTQQRYVVSFAKKSTNVKYSCFYLYL